MAQKNDKVKPTRRNQSGLGEKLHALLPGGKWNLLKLSKEQSKQMCGKRRDTEKLYNMSAISEAHTYDVICIKGTCRDNLNLTSTSETFPRALSFKNWIGNHWKNEEHSLEPPQPIKEEVFVFSKLCSPK